MSRSSEDTTRKLIQALGRRSSFDHPVDRIRVLETHISYVLLTGAFAYKIKKPVVLPFLDFSTLEKRYAACRDEVRINARLAPSLYMGVVPVGGSPDAPVVNGPGPVIEYAVKMRQFPETARLDRVLERGALSEKMITGLARQVAQFHAGLEPSGPADDKQCSEQRFGEISENFQSLEELPLSNADRRNLSRLREWSLESLVINGEHLRKRRREGFVRECHGDMHLANLALLDGEFVIFDALEFSENLRWIDVLSEIAFMVMDLLRRERPDLAALFLSTYLEITGDYEGLGLMRHYLVYRALVRAKVTGIRLRQSPSGSGERETAMRDLKAYLDLALRCIEMPESRFLLITCGPSGAGKSFISEKLCGVLGAIRVRSDAERRRRELPGENRYSAFARHRTYMRVETNADKVLQSGYSVIVDATCIRREYRERFWRLANDRQVSFGILWLTAPGDVLRRRVQLRSSAGKDASEATVEVLERQLEEIEPLSRTEREFALEVDTSADLDFGPVERFLRRIGRLPLEHRFRRFGP
ncbi:MAG: AAA family ATPase [Gammaproteobacteria bacterium]|nr:AAA family ATPase [Gammaproteobacteria bacterium]